MRRLLVCAAMVSIGCVSGGGDEGGASTGDTSTGAQTATDSETETETETETGTETDTGPDCEPDPDLESAYSQFNWAEDGPDVLDLGQGLECEVNAYASDNNFENLQLLCLVDGNPTVAELRVRLVVADKPALYPFAAGQALVLEWAYAGDAMLLDFNAIALRVTEADTQRLLLLEYRGDMLPQDLDGEPIAPSFFAPQIAAHVDTPCEEECSPLPGLGVPDDCPCRRPLDLEFRMGPEAPPTVIRSSSGALVDVPGEPPGYIGLASAAECALNNGTDAPDQYRWLYVAGVAP